MRRNVSVRLRRRGRACGNWALHVEWGIDVRGHSQRQAVLPLGGRRDAQDTGVRPRPPRRAAASLRATVGPCISLLTMPAVNASTAAACSGVRPRKRDAERRSSFLRIVSAYVRNSGDSWIDRAQAQPLSVRRSAPLTARAPTRWPLGMAGNGVDRAFPLKVVQIDDRLTPASPRNSGRCPSRQRDVQARGTALSALLSWPLQWSLDRSPGSGSRCAHDENLASRNAPGSASRGAIRHGRAKVRDPPFGFGGRAIEHPDAGAVRHQALDCGRAMTPAPRTSATFPLSPGPRPDKRRSRPPSRSTGPCRGWSRHECAAPTRRPVRRCCAVRATAPRSSRQPPGPRVPCPRICSSPTTSESRPLVTRTRCRSASWPGQRPQMRLQLVDPPRLPAPALAAALGPARWRGRRPRHTPRPGCRWTAGPLAGSQAGTAARFLRPPPRARALPAALRDG